MSRRKSVEPLYKTSDTVLCNFHGQLYDAIILETKHVDILEKEKSAASKLENSSEVPISVRSMSTENDQCSDDFAYYLHYKNWNSSWDEWVRSDCLMSITEEARQRQQELKLAARKEKIKKTSKKRRRKVGRKSVRSSSENDNLDEGLSEVGRVNETLESQEPMDDSISNFDDVCADEDELKNEGAEDSGFWQAAENLDDSTNTSANVDAEWNILNSNLPNDDSTLRGDNSSKLEKASKEKSMMDSNVPPPAEASAEEKEMNNPEKLGTSENQVESAPVHLTASSTSVEVKERMPADVGPADDVLPAKSMTSIAAQELETTTNHHHLEEKDEKVTLDLKGRIQKVIASNIKPARIVVEHPCSFIGTPTVNDVLPQLRDYLCSIDSVGNALGSAFVEKLGLMYEIFCKELILPTVKYDAEQAMIKSGVSAFGSVMHFSGLLRLISVLESGGWSNGKYYTRLQEAEISYELEDLQMIFHVCKEYFEAARRFLLSKQAHDFLQNKGSKSQQMEITDRNNVIQNGQTQASSCDILGERQDQCPSPTGKGVVSLDQECTPPTVSSQSQEKVDGDEKTSNLSDLEMEELKTQIEHSKIELLDKIPETAADTSTSSENSFLVDKSEIKSIDDRCSTQIPIHVSSKSYYEQKASHSSKSKSQLSKSDIEIVPVRTMRTRRSFSEGKPVENAISDHSDMLQKNIRHTRQRKFNTRNEVASETTLNTPSLSSAGSSSTIPMSPSSEAVVALLPVRRKRKSVVQNSSSPLNDNESHEDPGRVVGIRSSLRRKGVNYK